HGRSSDLLLLDVTPLDLGIAVHGGGFNVLIERNTTIPCSESHIFTTSRDNQTSIKVIVLQGESAKAAENEMLGEFTLAGLRPAPAGQVDVEITFDISADGIVKVSAIDLDTGKERSIQVTASSSLTEDEIQQMMVEHQDYLLDVAQGDAFEARRVEVGKILREVERLLPQIELAMGGSTLGGDALDKARAAVDEARDALDGKSATKLDNAKDSLRRTLALFKGIVERVQ